MTNLREPSNDAIKRDPTYSYEYNGYFYEALGFMAGMARVNNQNGVIQSSSFYESYTAWCEYYASYRIRCIIHKHDPVGISLAYDAFVAFELPQMYNSGATTPCEIDTNA